MKNSVSLLFLFVIMIASYSFINSDTAQADETGTTVKWYSFEEAVAANKRVKKKFMVDVYTDWCGWCKRMDASTFENPEVSAYLNKNFYPVKLDAEMKENIEFDGHTFNFVPSAGKRGVHTLAYSILEGGLSYPSIVFLDENVERVMISRGYKGPEDFINELKFTAEEHYKKQSFEAYKAATRKTE